MEQSETSCKNQWNINEIVLSFTYEDTFDVKSFLSNSKLDWSFVIWV